MKKNNTPQYIKILRNKTKAGNRLFVVKFLLASCGFIILITTEEVSRVGLLYLGFLFGIMWSVLNWEEIVGLRFIPFRDALRDNRSLVYDIAKVLERHNILSGIIEYPTKEVDNGEEEQTKA